MSETLQIHWKCLGFNIGAQTLKGYCISKINNSKGKCKINYALKYMISQQLEL